MVAELFAVFIEIFFHYHILFIILRKEIAKF